jgi:PmbA protein
MHEQKWLARAKELGFEQAEIYRRQNQDKEINWFEGAMDKYEISQSDKAGLRAIWKGKMADITLENLDDALMDQTFETLKAQASIITSTDEALLAGPLNPDKLPQKEFVQPSTAKVYEVLDSLEKKILAYDPRIAQAAYLGWSQGTSARSIRNTKGLDVSDQSAAQIIAATALAAQDDKMQDYTLVKVVPNLDDFDQDAFVKELCQEALDRLSAASIPTALMPVILEKGAMTSLLSAFSGLFSGDLISRNISPLKDKIGQPVFSDKITIIDDPRQKDALETAAFDDEGIPTKTKTVIDKGVFLQPLHNQKSAARMHTDSTGNGFKGGVGAPVDVSPMNMYIQSGQKSLKELEETMEDGLVITDLEGLHAGIDFVTTNFSLQARGYLVKHGKKDRAVTLITAADTFLHLLNNVKEVGNDLEWEYRQIASPSILFESLPISGE